MSDLTPAQLETKLAAWIDRTRGRFIDMDNYGTPLNQCWDLWAHYAVNVFGVPLAQTFTNYAGFGAHQGYACNVHHHAKAAGLEKWFTVLSAQSTPKRGDVVFWDYGSWPFSQSHVAIVTGTPKNGIIPVWTQNWPSGDHPRQQWLPMTGIIGYLRPKTTAAATAASTPKHGRKDHPIMFLNTYADAYGKGKRGWQVVGPGFYLELSTSAAAAGYARQLGHNAEEVDAGGWYAAKEAATTGKRIVKK